jgi:hypothetical protein
VTLSWSEPTLTTDRQSVRYIGPTLICRSVESEITACGNPAAIVAAPTVVPQKLPSGRSAKQKSSSEHPLPQIYTDSLPANMQQPDPSAEVTYAVEVLNRNARGADLSNRVHVPAIVTIPAPTDLSVELTDDGAVLTWTSKGESPNESAHPGLMQHYRIYRLDEASGKDAVAGEVPMDNPGPIHFIDAGFEWERTYLYRVTGVSIIQRSDTEVQVEGDDTPPVRVVAHDIFPPSVPTGLQAAYSGEGQKPFNDLIWAPVTSADLAGYNVYRSTANGEAIKLNSDLIKTPSYRDTAVTAGTTYTYKVSAKDVRGNESQRSEATSESVP